jgi:organic radical activating enzyme
MLTTYCDRLCPDCCCNIPEWNNKTNYDWAYLENSAKFFKGIRRINLSGGEPTLHPNFVEFAPKLKELFQCNVLTIESNGYGFKKFPEVFKYFDVIQVSHYTKDSYEGSTDNTEDVEFIKDYLKGTNTSVLIGEIVHISRERRSSGIICGRGESETVSYVDGLLYPCCAAPGVEGRIGIPLSDNWIHEIEKVKMPCENCWFSLP